MSIYKKLQNAKLDRFSKPVKFGIAILLLPLIGLAQQLPPDFYTEPIQTNFQFPVGMTFDETGQMYVWEKGGKIYVVDTNHVKINTPLLDISEEVGAWRDHGLLGFTLDPNFRTNGYYYALYAVDLHYLKYFGTPDYSADSTFALRPAIARITRYTADIATNFTTTIPNSRMVLVGEMKDNSFVITHESHGVGSLVFGDDYTLMASWGDGSSYNGTDLGGSNSDSYGQKAIAEGLMESDQDIGAFKSQYLGSYNGKVIRIDPITGDGVASNPFYDAAIPRSAKSRTWALGFRNPFRMILKPGSGSHAVTDGNPGTLLVGDVGAGSFEELNIITQGGQNFGWPFTEGYDHRTNFLSAPIPDNLFAPNPENGNNGCTDAYFSLLETFNSAVLGINSPQNSCNTSLSIPAEYQTQEKPASLVWTNFLWNQPTRAFVFENNAPKEISGSNTVNGVSFDGVSSIPGVFYNGTRFPEEFQGTYFQGDFLGWIRAFKFDENMNVVKIDPFFENIDIQLVHIALHPNDGCLYYIDYATGIHRICYGGNPPPVVVATVDTFYTPAPSLTVNFDALDSYSPFNYPLTFKWEFTDDGTISTDPQPTHTFFKSDNNPTTYLVHLTVTDSTGTFSTKTIEVFLNNTPPQVAITSFEDGDKYAAFESSILELQAEVSDAEHNENQLTYSWQTFLHHNTHFHPESADNQKQTSTVISPVGCGDELFYYRIALTVTDGHGLSTTVEKSIYPDCEASFVPDLNLTYNGKESTIDLSWSVSAENNAVSYEVQRGDNNFKFRTIGTFTPNGSNTYQFTDDAPFLGTNFYRIKAKSSEQAFRYSNIVNVSFPTFERVLIFPNPTDAIFKIQFKQAESIATLRLYNSIGQEQLVRTFLNVEQNHIEEIITTQLGTGVYMGELEFESGKERFQLVIQR